MAPERVISVHVRVYCYVVSIEVVVCVIIITIIIMAISLGSKPAENFGARGTEERSNDEPSRILLKM